MKKRPREERDVDATIAHELDLFRQDWLRLAPAERLARSWALRARLRDPQAVHDAKLFPKP